MIALSHPAVLAAGLPALLLVLALLRGRRDDEGPARRTASLVARLLLLLALLVAASGPSTEREAVEPSTTVFLLDVSDSVTEEQVEAAAGAIESASREIASKGGRAALVAFAGNGLLLRPPAAAPLDLRDEDRIRFRRAEARLKAGGDEAALAKLREARRQLDPLRTRPAAGLSIAQELLASGPGRAILLTDGVFTEPAAPLPGGAELRYVRLPEARARDVVLRDFRAPLAVRTAEPFDLEVDLWSGQPAEVSLALSIDDVAVAGEPERRRLPAGASTWKIRNVGAARPLPQGVHRIAVVASSPEDLEPRNNSAAAVLTVVGKARVLLVEAPGAGGLGKLLAAQGIEHQVITPDRFNASLDPLDDWAAVLLAGVVPESISPGAAAALATYVENGGGLLVSAGPEPGTPTRDGIAKLLPVERLAAAPTPTPSPSPSPGPTPPPGPTPTPAPGPTPTPKAEPRKVLAPPIALLLLVDKSGSMSGDPIALCKEAAIATAETLSDRDFLGVVGFDARPQLAVPFTEAAQIDTIRTQLLRLFAAGGTDIHPALVAAHRLFKDDPRARAAGVKHVVLLSDGVTPDNPDFEKTVRAMAEDGIVVSTVCVVSPDGFRDALLRRISEWGRGRYFFADSFKSVPRIFTDEAKFIVRENLKAAEDKAARATPPVKPPDGPPVVPTPTPTAAPTPPPVPTPAPPPPLAARPVRFKDPHEAMNGIPRDPAPPPLSGAIAARARPTAVVPLAFEDGAPVLAAWRYGLGRCAYWASDVGGPWSAGWERWAGTTKLFAQLVRHLSNAVEDVELASRVRVERHPDRVEFVSGPGIEIHEVAPGRARVPAAVDADGAWRSVLPLRPGATHQVSILRSRDGQSESLPAEFAVLSPPELLPPPDRPAAFPRVEAEPPPVSDLARLLPPATMARRERSELAGTFLLAALLLLPVDVAIRRFRR